MFRKLTTDDEPVPPAGAHAPTVASVAAASVPPVSDYRGVQAAVAAPYISASAAAVAAASARQQLLLSYHSAAAYSAAAAVQLHAPPFVPPLQLQAPHVMARGASFAPHELPLSRLTAAAAMEGHRHMLVSPAAQHMVQQAFRYAPAAAAEDLQPSWRTDTPPQG